MNQACDWDKFSNVLEYKASSYRLWVREDKSPDEPVRRV